MTGRMIQAGERNYTFSPDDPIPLGSRIWALVQARVLDELTDRPPATMITVESDLAHSSSRVVSNSLVGLVGIPERVFPSLARRNYRVQLTVRVPGYIPCRVTALIPNDQRTIAAPAPAINDTVMTLNDTARLGVGEFLLVNAPGPAIVLAKIRALGPNPNQVTFVPAVTATTVPAFGANNVVVPVVPVNFAPTNPGNVMLHRRPVIIRGRVVRVAGSTVTQVSGAVITITGIWRTVASTTSTTPTDPATLVSVHPPLYFDRSAASSQLEPGNLPAVPDPPASEKHLLEHVPAGARDILITNQVGLSGTSILLIDADKPNLLEFVEIVAITGGATPDHPARISLRHPVVYEHRVNALVQRANSPALGPGTPFTQDAQVGDTCIFLNNLAGLTSGAEVRLSDGSNPDEYHRVRLFTVTSDANGYYRLPPVSRVAQLQIQVSDGATPPRIITTRFSPDCTVGENQLDLIFN